MVRRWSPAGAGALVGVALTSVVVIAVVMGASVDQADVSGGSSPALTGHVASLPVLPTVPAASGPSDPFDSGALSGSVQASRTASPVRSSATLATQPATSRPPSRSMTPPASSTSTTSPPMSATAACVSSAMRYQCTATFGGFVPARIQWYRDGWPISGAISATYSVACSMTQASMFSVTGTNAAGMWVTGQTGTINCHL